MPPRARALGEDFRAVLDTVAAARGLPTTRDVAALGRALAALSAVYNDTTSASVRASDDDALAARLAFSFPRDVPKGEAAVSELVGLDALPIESGRLSMLDLGAGLGAMTWGVARALDRVADRTEIVLQADLVDRDTGALALAQRILHERSRVGRVTIEPRLTQGGASAAAANGRRYGLVFLGQVLSELDRERTAEERLARHVELLRRIANEALLPGGAVVVVEPALRDRTRHLHRVRDALITAGVRICAPCTHQASCPALSIEDDWCHEDLAVDLPPWLVPIARAAGLRYQGLTFSYLVLRNDERSVRELAQLRVVRAPRVTKGKSDVLLCGATGHVAATRLDRARSDANAAWDDLERGDLVVVEPEPTDAKVRIDASTRVTKAREQG